MASNILAQKLLIQERILISNQGNFNIARFNEALLLFTLNAILLFSSPRTDEDWGA